MKNNFAQNKYPIYTNNFDIPFVDNDKVICNLFNDGILTQTYLKNYINIKHNYSTYVISRIAFFDKISLTDSKSVEIKNMINCELKKLEQ